MISGALVELERENMALAQVFLTHIQARSRAGLTCREIRDLEAAQRSAERIIRTALGTLCRSGVVSEIAKNR